MSRKVRVHFMLVGKTNTPITEDDVDSQCRYDYVQEKIREQWGARPIVCADSESAIKSVKYPDYFAAGWFIDDTSELVVVAHGNSMKSARENMLNRTSMVDWKGQSGLI